MLQQGLLPGSTVKNLTNDAPKNFTEHGHIFFTTAEGNQPCTGLHTALRTFVRVRGRVSRPLWFFSPNQPGAGLTQRHLRYSVSSSERHNVELSQKKSQQSPDDGWTTSGESTCGPSNSTETAFPATESFWQTPVTSGRKGADVSENLRTQVRFSFT